MLENMSDRKVFERKAADNIYLHKDFHGSLCYMIEYLNDNYGSEYVEKFFTRVAETVYSPLIEKLKNQGLAAMEIHLRDIFDIEQGEYEITYCKNELRLEVKKCPAIAYLKENGVVYHSDFCMTTKVVNEAICEKANINFCCESNVGKGTCIQRFWKEECL